MFGLFRKTECDNIRGKLSEYIDKCLDTARQEEVEAHLEKCQVCHAELETLQLTVNLLHRLPLVPVPRSFTLKEAEPVRPDGIRVTLNVLRGATTLAALALAILLLGDVFSYYGGTAPVREEAMLASAPSVAETTDQPPSAAEKLTGASAEGRGYAFGGSPTPEYAEDSVQVPVAGATQPALAQTPEVAAEEESATEEGVIRTFALSSWSSKEIIGPLRGIHIGLLGVVAVLGGATLLVSRRQGAKT